MGPGDALSQLFPEFVPTALARCEQDVSSPYSQEAAIVAAAAPRRRADFFTGRACAHRALRALGVDGGPIMVGRGRQPLWPHGVVGSIAHGGGWAGAVVARSTDAVGLGLDIEPIDPPLAPDVARMVVGPEDHPGDDAGHPLGPYATKVAFSAKECVFKTLYPLTEWPLEFCDVGVDVDLDGGRWKAALDDRFRLPGVFPQAVGGRFVVSGGLLLAGLCVRAEGDDGHEGGR